MGEKKKIRHAMKRLGVPNVKFIGECHFECDITTIKLPGNPTDYEKHLYELLTQPKPSPTIKYTNVSTDSK